MSDNKNLKSACRAVWLWVPVAFPSRVQQSEKLFRLNLLSEISRHIFNPFFCLLRKMLPSALIVARTRESQLEVWLVITGATQPALARKLANDKGKKQIINRIRAFRKQLSFPSFSVTVLKWTKLRRNGNNNYTVWLLIKLKGEGWCIQHFIICLSSVKG